MTMQEKQRLNAYTCQKCKATVITIDKDNGVTPFIIPCLTEIESMSSLVEYPKNRHRKCNGDMYSHFYTVPPFVTPLFEWFKPDIEALNKCYSPLKVKLYNKDMRDHIKNGGLDLRKIKNGY